MNQPEDPTVPCDHPGCSADSIVTVNRRRACQPHIEWLMHQAFAGTRALRHVAGMDGGDRIEAWLSEAGMLLRLAALAARSPRVDDPRLAESCDAVALQAEDLRAHVLSPSWLSMTRAVAERSRP